MRRSLIFFSFMIGSLLTVRASLAQASDPLLTSIRNNDIALVASLLDKGASASVVDEDSANTLMYAALYSTPDCMRLLLKKGADPNARNKIGETAIMWCSHDLEKTKLLLDNKASLNIQTKRGNTPLLIACVGENQQDIIRLLLDRGADPLARNQMGATALMRVALFGDTAIARGFLNKGVDINAKTKESETALFGAVKCVNKTMVHWLLNNGADANLMDNYKALPLAYAVVVDEITLVDALLGKTKEINNPDIDGMTLLMWATYNENDNPRVIQALLDRGALINLKDKNGATALTWALKKGNTATVALLKKAGAQ
jgi:ankyrin repeat protein